MFKPSLSKPSSRLGVSLIAAALVLLPFVVGGAFGDTWVRVIDLALLYIMLALGLNIVVGYAGLLDLGYIAFFAVGAYLYALLNSPQFGVYLPVLVILPLCALLAGVCGALLGAPTLRLRGDYLAIVTLGFGEIVRIFMNNLNTPVNITNGPQGISGIAPFKILGVSLSRPIEMFGISIPSVHLYYYLFIIFSLLIVFVSMRLQNSRIGRAWVAIREDEVAAKACGINTRNVKLLAFAMGASFGGVSGGLFASFQQFVSPESFGLLESVMVLCMVVMGGMGSIAGVILGGLLLTVLPELFRHGAGPVQQAVFGKVLIDPEALRMLLFGLSLIVVMLYRPAGLWPESRHKSEIDDAKKEGETA